MSADGFQGQTGLVLFFSLKSKYIEQDYITHPVSCAVRWGSQMPEMQVPRATGHVGLDG